MKDHGLAFKKGPTRRQLKDRKQRHEQTVKQTVREQVADRDGYCRLRGVLRFGPCSGASEWAHLTKRSQTMGKPAEERHAVDDSVMLCNGHHQSGPLNHEHGTLKVEKLTERGANGPLRFYGVDVDPYTEIR